jgi:protein-L-isoaspartate(D-aspartate) O-methyltransferase
MHISYDEDVLADNMVRDQVISRGITDGKVCSVMRKIPRWFFMPGISKERAYEDHPMAIGHGQTISQPYIVALMTELLELGESDRVLEIGTGSGYQTAVLAELCLHVYTIDRIPELLVRAKNLLTEIGYTNITFINEDGSDGWAENAPYDKILVTAAAPVIPERLKQQLSDNGKMVVPVGDFRTYQVLKIITRIANSFNIEESIGCRFVPLLGKDAFTL